MWYRLVIDNSIQIFHDVVLFEGVTLTHLEVGGCW